MPSGSWRDAADRPVEAPPVPGPADPPFYVAIGEHQGATYRRNAFAAGTDDEVAALRDALGLRAGHRVLDVGCGDGRHLRALMHDGVHGHGVDASPALIDAARRATPGHADGSARFVVADARALRSAFHDRVSPLDGLAGRLDAAWSLHQGALGTSPSSDPEVVAGLAAAVRPGGRVAFTCFHALFAARHLAPGDAFDTVELVHHQVSEVHGVDDARRRFDLWTTAYTVREAARLATDAGLDVTAVRGVEPGRYRSRHDGEVGLDDPEVLVIARRPSR